MPEEAKVSIICNAYNHEKYIRDALEGFVMQKTDFPFVVLIHDDASTDGTASIIREYEEKYPDIVKPIYETENQYQKSTLRKIQEDRVHSKYVAVCEGDDYWTDPLKLQKQFDYMEAHPDCALCGCTTGWLNMKTGKLDIRYRVDEDRDVSEEELIEETNGRIFTTCSVFAKAEIWIRRPKWGFPIGDYPLNLYAGLNGAVHVLREPMCVYRWYTENSWTKRMDGAGKRAEVARKMIEGLANFNEASGGRYAESVRRRTLRHRYTLALMEADWETVSGELGEVYRSRGFLERVSDRLRCKHPKLYELVHKITYGRLKV